jgi:hypothetical protein
MNKVDGLKLETVPLDKLLFVATSAPDCEMNRILIVEDWPNWNDITVIEGSHCSCYGFDETQWDAITYTEDEFGKVVTNWPNGTDTERMITTMWVATGRAK